MTNDIKDNILNSLNQCLQRQQRNILLFLDNAPCHSSNLEHHFNIFAQLIPRQRCSHLTAELWQAGNVNTRCTFYVMFAAKSMDLVM